jgi:hypothetical protein
MAPKGPEVIRFHRPNEPAKPEPDGGRPRVTTLRLVKNAPTGTGTIIIEKPVEPAAPSSPTPGAMTMPLAPAPTPEADPQSDRRTRAIASLTLLLFIAGFSYLGYTGFRALSDSFVAPQILAPNSETVLNNKLKVTELAVERARSMGEAEGLANDVVADDKALGRLAELKNVTANALAFTSSMNQHAASAGSSDLSALGGQAGVLSSMLSKQSEATARAKANMETGLITRADFAKEQQSLDSIKLALLENGRARVQSELQMHQVKLGQSSLAGNTEAPMPEVVQREDQMVRIELEMLRLESEKATKNAQRKVLEEKIAAFDQLEDQLRALPTFQASERDLDVAFVPYTQLDGVKAGSDVYQCIWGLFGCTKVGVVTEVAPGEVMAPDPWGNQSRGQYAILKLFDHEAAKAKVLRIRPAASSAAPAPKASKPAAKSKKK